MRRQKLYSTTAVDDFAREAVEKYDYCMIQIEEGTLGSGHFVLIPPDDNHYGFEIREVALNEWNSAHILRRFRKMSKRLAKEIEDALNAEYAKEEYAS